MHKQVKETLNDPETYLIRYKLLFPERRSNPLVHNFRYVYKEDSFNRIQKKHGQTLLSLAFNYGVISLMTLTFGTGDLEVSVQERPPFCLNERSEDEALDVVLYLLARDFDYTNTTISIHDEQRICLRYIVTSRGVADFKPRCYSGDKAASMDSGDIGNQWIDSLYVLMLIVKIFLLGFGPLFFVEYVATLSQESAPYVVKLQEPLLRTLFVAKTVSDFNRVRGDRILNLSNCRGFPKLKLTLEKTPFGRPFQAKISEYDILAANNRLIMENEVPVTFWGALAEAIFRCKVKNTGPMQSCCYVDMFRNISPIKRRIPWISFWSKVGSALLIFFLPFLYYLRLILYYVFEYQELQERRAAAEKLNLQDSFDNSLVHYLHPTHWFFITIYVIYFVSAFTLAYLTRSDDDGRFRNIVVGSFADLGRLSYLRVFQMMIENFIWPFKRYGILGCCVAIVYWPIALPLTLIVYIFYSIPTIYLTVRMLFYSRRAFLEQIRTRSGVRKYQISDKDDNNLDLFQADFLFGVKDVKHEPAKLSEISEEVDELDKYRMAADSKKEKPTGDTISAAPRTIIRSLRIRPSRFLQHALASFMCMLSLYALLIIVSECFGSLVEIAVFTMMGIVVNAGLTVKYAGLVIMVIVYSYDCFNNIQVRYYKLNKALFKELRSRVKGLNDVTSLPSYLQENQAFKSEEQSEQGAHENPDDIAEQPPRHWLINDLVLFVDNEDAFRIPRRLFKQVCEIRVAGVPGPIYEGVIEAIKHFLKMLVFVVFVFLVVLCFGDVYELSSTTQMMAVLATGFLPIILEQFMEPHKPDIEVNSLSFKSKLDEVIKNFWQLWPIHDFSFTVMPDLNTTQSNNSTLNQVTTDANTAALAKKQMTGVKQETGSEIKLSEIKLAENKATAAQTETKTATQNPSAAVHTGPSASAIGSGLGRFISSGGNERASIRPSASAGELNRTQNNNSTVYQVDLMIQLPSKYEDEWVDGWSNIIEIKQDNRKKASDVATSMIETAAEKAGSKS